MKVKIIKDHYLYSGTVDLDEARAKYLVAVGVAEEVKSKKKEVEEDEADKKKKKN